MNSFIKIWKEDKGSRPLFIMFAIMISLGFACAVFALFYSVK